MAEERGKPFVGWIRPMDRWGSDEPIGSHIPVRDRCERGFTTPVVVTPLLPDDPRPGETWLYKGGLPSWVEAEIVSAPFPYHGGEGVVMRTGGGTFITERHRLRRPPVLRTYRLKVDEWLDPIFGQTRSRYHKVEAESKEAAIAKLSDALEEVPEP